MFSELNCKLKSVNVDSVEWYPKDCLRNAAFNIIYKAMFNKTLDIKNPKYIEYKENIRNIISNVRLAFFADYLPKFLEKLLLPNAASRFQTSISKMFELVRNDYNELLIKIDNNNNNNNSNNNNNDNDSLVESIYREYMTENRNKMDKLTQDRLIGDLWGLLLAGMDSTAQSTEKGLLLLAKYPKLQQTVYQELFRVFGSQHDGFSLSKIHQCPKFKAFIKESLRIACAAQIGLPHSCEKTLRCIKLINKQSGEIVIECDFADKFNQNNFNISEMYNVEYDYIIEKRSIIQANIGYLLLKDKTVWNLDNNPIVPNLNYWLSSKDSNFFMSRKQKKKIKKQFVPFGVGPRDCLGQALAIKEMYAFLGNLLLKYKINPATGTGPQMSVRISIRDPFVEN